MHAHLLTPQLLRRDILDLSNMIKLGRLPVEPDMTTYKKWEMCVSLLSTPSQRLRLVPPLSALSQLLAALYAICH